MQYVSTKKDSGLVAANAKESGTRQCAPNSLFTTDLEDLSFGWIFACTTSWRTATSVFVVDEFAPSQTSISLGTPILDLPDGRMYKVLVVTVQDESWLYFLEDDPFTCLLDSGLPGA